MLGMVCLVAADQNIELCNSNTNGPAIPAYTNYIRFLYQHGLSVLPITMPGNCDQYDVADLLVDGLVDTIPFVDALGGANFDINQQHAYCNAVAQNILHAQAGTDLTVKWLTAWPVTYTQPFNPAPTYMTQVFTLMTDPTYTHNFVAKTYKTTVWTSVYLQPPSAYDEGTVPLVYEVSADFYNQAMTFSQQGFSGFETYIQFAPSVQSRLVQVQAPGNGKCCGASRPWAAALQRLRCPSTGRPLWLSRAANPTSWLPASQRTAASSARRPFPPTSFVCWAPAPWPPNTLSSRPTLPPPWAKS